jgi:hypothetical protein
MGITSRRAFDAKLASNRRILERRMAELLALRKLVADAESGQTPAVSGNHTSERTRKFLDGFFDGDTRRFLF